MNKITKFSAQVKENIQGLSSDKDLQKKSLEWMIDAGGKHQYSYNFSWMGRPIIQYPQDMIAMQEIIWELKPDLIIETGIAHGGSLIYYASLLELLSVSGYGDGKIIGIDIDIRKHNRVEIESHPMFKRIEMIEGSSIASNIIDQIKEYARDKNKILVILDSNHTHEHVLAELEAYAPLVTPGSYCVVFDTLIEDTPKELITDRPWGKGDSPKTAVWEYLRRLKTEGRMASDGTSLVLNIDKAIEKKLLITVAPDGYLRRG